MPKVKFLSDQANLLNSLAVCVTETWLSKDIADSELLVHFPGYDLFRSDRINRGGGGVCIFLKEGLGGECLGSFDNGVCELLLVQIHSLNTVIALVYRPPDTRLAEFTPILNEIEVVMSSLSLPSPIMVLCGDFNFPSSVMTWPKVEGHIVPSVHSHREVNDDEGLMVRLQAQKLCNLALQHHMVQMVDQPDPKITG